MPPCVHGNEPHTFDSTNEDILFRNFNSQQIKIHGFGTASFRKMMIIMMMLMLMLLLLMMMMIVFIITSHALRTILKITMCIIGPTQV